MIQNSKLEIRNFPSVSIIIPARNEKGNIEPIIQRLPELQGEKEIIFIEGHSNDGTLEEIKRVAAKYGGSMPISFAVQGGVGKADAVWKGFELAKNDILIILDADMGVAPEDLLKFYEAMLSGGKRFVNGSRYAYEMEKGAMRPLNNLGNKFFTVFLSWVCGKKLTDTLCGTKAIFKSDFEQLKKTKFFKEMDDPFGDFKLLIGASLIGLNIVEVPVVYHKREYGATKISRFRDGWKLLKMMMFVILKFKPQKKNGD
ncbi:MAG: glycosyltransferase family 2 protein [Patescibacteria group bacterium]